ncbi:SMC family ATPase [Robertmurraya korlensis]|uniref:AAA family ATPase n=1 Tax=Robertmurraya korlensis TaxID=519977 RepID=UPI0020406902|nr:SMC family ATPase [Robertmurraya korlensis]MCM3601394.1 SMC family ATPase [Robertmurraya korlensis]
MRPLKLTMQAFGPYSRTEVIDFFELGNRTMFVISGKTGSGKTTIFDGISYAIYGKASGEDRNGPELRSQFADNDTLTEVSLEFRLRGKTYEISRSPQQEKKKSRGDGVTSIGAKAELYVYDEDGTKQIIASNVRDVDEKIKQIMLIDSNQFRQIIMIPQGEFRKLLTSDSKEKEAILQRLFHTQLYKRIEEKLKEEAASLKAAVEKQLADRNLAIQKIHALFTDDLKEYMEAGSTNDLVIVPALIEEIQAMAEQISLFEKEIVEKDQLRQVEQKKLYDAETLIKQFEAKETARQNKLHLENQKELFEKKKNDVELGKKAILLLQQEQLCARLKKELTTYEAQANDLLVKQKTLLEQVHNLEEVWRAEKGKEPERKALEEGIHKLRSLKEDVHSYAKLEAEIRDLQLQWKKLEEDKLAAEKKGTEIDHRLKLYTEKKEEIDASKLVFLENKSLLDELKREADLISTLEKQKESLFTLEEKFNQKKAEFERTTARYLDSKSLVEELENSWMHGQASILASKLQDGAPCPVCGSEHHPKPTHQVDKAIPNETDLKAAKQQLEGLENERNIGQSEVFKLQSSVEASTLLVSQTLVSLQANKPEFLIENLSTFKETVLSKKRDVEAEQLKLQTGLEQLDTISEGLKKLETAKAEWTLKAKELDEAYQEARLSFVEKNSHFTRLQEIIPETIRSVDRFEQEVNRQQKQLNELNTKLEQAQMAVQNSKVSLSTIEGQLHSVQQSKETKQAELQVEREVFIEKLEQQGFQNYKQYESAKRSEVELQQMEAEISNYRESLRSVTDRYTELEALLKDVPMPNIQALTDLIEKMTQEIKDMDGQKSDLSFKKRENEQILETIYSLNKEMKQYEEQYKMIGNLADISKGNNNLRITFERYVLGSFLDDILREANGRLLKMTSGRFQLLRKLDKSKGNTQSGLELLVVDSYTGQERHVKTLSGGESFKASLSLALGLADVVQNYAGGVSLETMFIDEGFGTLDPESLDQAIEALIDIQSSGRLVGIISHVPELKERIDARLEVVASQSGSTTYFQFIN